MIYRVDDGKGCKVLKCLERNVCLFVGWLVGWCVEPSKRQRITLGLNINFNLFPSYSLRKSLYHKSFFFSLKHTSNLSSIWQRKTKQQQNNTCFEAYFYSASTQHGNLHPAGWPMTTTKTGINNINNNKESTEFTKTQRLPDMPRSWKEGAKLQASVSGSLSPMPEGECR